MGVLAGVPNSEDPLTSTFAFCRQVVGYDLESFFCNAAQLREQVVGILEALLEPS